MKTLCIAIAAVVLLAACSGKTTGAQGSEPEKADLKEIMNSRNYVFNARTAIPARGRTINLNSDYWLTVTKDSIISFLPFFGRAYTAPIGQTSGGIEFTSTDFDYNESSKANGAFEIEIVPRDHNNVQRLFLSISRSGYGSLYVTSQNRQGITFNGVISRRN